MADASAGRTLEDRKRDLERAHAEGSTSTMDHAKLNSATARTPTSLATAAAAGDMDAVAAHISAKVDVNGEVDFGGTALLHAASKGQMAAAVALLAAGADPTRASKGGRNAVHLAAERNHAATIEAMLSSSETCKSECLDAQDKDGRTPLMLAAQGDAAAACKALIASGAGLEIQEHGEGEGPFDTALLLAARLGKVESARALAEAGADYYELDDGSYRALDAARQGSHPSEEVREAMYDMLLDVMLDRE